MREDKDCVCYELLMKVFRDNAYASIELNNALALCAESDKPYVTKMFYGVLERNVYYDYVLGLFAKDKPKKSVATVIKMGYYLLENMNVPAYAAVDNTVKLCKRLGKGGASGFVNSALRKFGEVKLPQAGSAHYLSVKYSYPLWLCELLTRDYGYDFTKDFLSHEPECRTHIRVNFLKTQPESFEKKYGLDSEASRAACGVEKTAVGYYMPRKVLDKIDNTEYFVQSASSVAAVYAYLYGIKPNCALDLCAAPGGKSVLAASIAKIRLIACDIHSHRVGLIEKYAKNAGADISVMQNDATVFRPEWENKFELVICDVPCSGIGVAGSKPDILFNRSPGDISELTKIQSAILQTASRYVANGGRLCYSTCTIIKEENDNIISKFLKENANFAIEKIKSPYCDEEKNAVELFPHIHNTDGFFVAAMKKIAL